MVRIIRRSGKVEERGESIGEFKARKQAERIKSRGLTRSEKKRLEREGLTKEDVLTGFEFQARTAEPLKQPKGTTIIQKADGTPVFQRIIKQGGKVKVIETPVSSLRTGERAVTTISKPKRTTKARLLTGVTTGGETLRGLLTTKTTRARAEGKPEGIIPLTPKGFKRRKELVEVRPEITRVESFTLESKARKVSPKLAKGIVEVKKRRKLTPEDRAFFEAKIKKAEIKKDTALKKIMKVFTNIELKNKRFDRRVDKVLDFIAPDNKSAPKSVRFSQKVGKEVIKLSAKWTNPVIVGFELGGGLEAYRTAQEADIISTGRLTASTGRFVLDAGKVGVVGGVAVAREIKNLDTQALKARVKKATDILKRGAKASKSFASTPEGLATIITIAVLTGVPQAVIKAGVKAGKATPSFLRTVKTQSKRGIKELGRTTKAMFKDKSGTLRGSRKRRITKAELRKQTQGVSKFTTQKQSRKAFQQQLKAVKPKTPKVDKLDISKTKVVRVSKDKALIKRGKRVIGTVGKKKVKKPKKPSAVKKITLKKQPDVFVQTGSGGQVQLVAKRVKSPKKTVKKVAQRVKQKVAGRIDQRLEFRKAKTKKVVKDVLEEDLTALEKSLSRGGGRESVKAKLIARLKAKKEALAKAKKNIEIIKVRKVKKKRFVKTDRVATGKTKLVSPPSVNAKKKPLEFSINSQFFSGKDKIKFENIGNRIISDIKSNTKSFSLKKQEDLFKALVLGGTKDKVLINNALKSLNNVKLSFRINKSLLLLSKIRVRSEKVNKREIKRVEKLLVGLSKVKPRPPSVSRVQPISVAKKLSKPPKPKKPSKPSKGTPKPRKPLKPALKPVLPVEPIKIKPLKLVKKLREGKPPKKAKIILPKNKKKVKRKKFKKPTKTQFIKFTPTLLGSVRKRVKKKKEEELKFFTGLEVRP